MNESCDSTTGHGSSATLKNGRLLYRIPFTGRLRLGGLYFGTGVVALPLQRIGMFLLGNQNLSEARAVEVWGLL